MNVGGTHLQEISWQQPKCSDWRRPAADVPCELRQTLIPSRCCCYCSCSCLQLNYCDETVSVVPDSPCSCCGFLGCECVDCAGCDGGSCASSRSRFDFHFHCCVDCFHCCACCFHRWCSRDVEQSVSQPSSPDRSENPRARSILPDLLLEALPTS